MGSLPSDLQNAQIWPIRALGAVQRHQFADDPTVQQYYQKAMEDGRFLESSIGDANASLLKRKKDLQEKIQQKIDSAILAADGQNKHRVRVFLYIADGIKFLQEVQQFQSEITGIISAVQSNIGQLQSMETNLLAMVNANLQSIALLMNNICNWGLPSLPSIPNLIPDSIFHWNGFNFSPLAAFAALKPNLTFNTNFSFSQCIPQLPGYGNIFTNQPTMVTQYSGNTLGTTSFVPPLGGTVPPANQDYTDPTFISQMQSTTATPVYLPANSSTGGTQTPFNPNSSMLGAVPDPNTIISDYQMPAATYAANIVSIVPALRDNTIEPTDADYANPNLTVRQSNLRAALVHNINLGAVVASNFDPYITSAWVFYLGLTRMSRGGNWINNLEGAYTQYIQPTLTSFADNAVPWNNYLDGPGLQNTPTDIPLIDTLTAATPLAQGNILWKLSYVEAGLLGYTRNATWDAYADNTYLSSFTGTDTDYKPTAINPSQTTTVQLGEGVAEFPVLCTYPNAIQAVLNQVIAIATANINLATTYQSPRAQNRFTFDQFGTATQVDRFSQFWRDFNANLQALLVQDPYLVQFVVTYVGSLDSAVDPLGNPLDYNTITVDAATRNRQWTPGTPLLPIPVTPAVAFQNNTAPDDTTSGWTGNTFNPTAFLSRPDIQAQPIPVQIAMLRTNLSYQGILQFRDQAQAAIQSSISQAQTALAQAQQLGFQVESSVDTTSVLPGNQGNTISFDKIDFDVTNNVTSPNTFTIQAAGAYTISGQLLWGPGDVGTRTVTIYQNGNSVFTISTDPSTAGPITLPFFTTLNGVNVGDVFTVSATDDLATPQTILTGSQFSMVQFDSPSASLQVPTNANTAAKAFVAGANFPIGTAVYFNANGDLIPVDPTIPIPVHPPAIPPAATPIVDGIALAAGETGQPLEVGTTFGGVFQILGASFTVGGLIYAGLGGALTQDYATLITSGVNWVVVVGRAISADSFVFEPHVPTTLP
jgi:hypothetical protein